MILWMRHGESTWNAAGRLQGRTAHPPLTDLGREQVAEAARGLEGRGVTVVVTSPAVRAHQSAAIVAEHLGLALRVEPLLVERGHGESLADVEGRVRRVIDADLPDGALLVTHGDVVAIAVGLLTGTPAGVPPNASVRRTGRALC